MRSARMVSVPPFVPSAEWYAGWLCARMSGEDDAGAIVRANAALESEKDFARCRIFNGGVAATLSIPVEGGSKTLKRKGGIASAVLSDHGNWRHVHLGTLEAAYGRAPYYQHLIPLLREAFRISSLPENNSLASFNIALHHTVLGFLGLPADTPVPPTYAECGFMCTPAAERGRELAAGAAPGISVIDALMKRGRESLLMLRAMACAGNDTEAGALPEACSGNSFPSGTL